MKLKLTLAAVALLLTFGSAAAHADSLILTLTNDGQSISSQTGGTLTFTATAFAPGTNGAPVDIVGDSFNGNYPALLDDSPFLGGFPFSLNPADSFTGDLFNLTFLPDTALGVYFGTFSITNGAGDPVGTVNFTTYVTPEPSSFVLLGTGAAGVFAAIKRRRLS